MTAEPMRMKKPSERSGQRDDVLDYYLMYKSRGAVGNSNEKRKTRISAHAGKPKPHSVRVIARKLIEISKTRFFQPVLIRHVPSDQIFKNTVWINPKLRLMLKVARLVMSPYPYSVIDILIDAYLDHLQGVSAEQYLRVWKVITGSI